MPVAIDPPPPFPPPDPIDLGTRFRGDTVTFVATFTDDQGNIVDLTTTDIWFTAKEDLAQDDLEGTGFQLSTRSSGIDPIEPLTDGKAQVTIPPSATTSLVNDTLFFWDLQCKHGPDIVTRQSGQILFVRDVTRAIS